ncbi:helix-turn-helix domain-containing protein [Nocardia fluminea]|uniref:XRE family transcriptional regulator n=1 Tax=Nocardia fluminea TaxID=134984 RepID=UPI00364785F7
MSTVVYLNRAQFAERIGVKPPTLSRYTLSRADAITGSVGDAGEPLPGSVRGWLPETIDA